LPKKIKFLLWLTFHDLVPTLSLLNHRNISHSAVCNNRCDFHNETFLHCLRDCTHSKPLWHQTDFTHLDFFSNEDAINWIKNGVMGFCSFSFASTIWWTWRNKNMMRLSNENLSNAQSFNIQGMIDALK